MKLMSEEGVSSVAVIDDESGALLSAVSVTDIGKVTSTFCDDYSLILATCRLLFLLKANRSYPHHCISLFRLSR